MNSMNGMKRKRKLLNELKPNSEQLACINEAQSIYKDIYEGFKNQDRKTFLIEEDFQELQNVQEFQVFHYSSRFSSPTF